MGCSTHWAVAKRQVRELRRVDRELWLIYVLKILESYAYFSTSLNLTLYLSEAFEYTDVEAGIVFSAWGGVTGVAAMACGPLIDRMGVRASLLLGGALASVGRIAFAAARSRAAVLLGLLVLQPAGIGLGSNEYVHTYTLTRTHTKVSPC